MRRFQPSPNARSTDDPINCRYLLAWQEAFAFGGAGGKVHDDADPHAHHIRCNPGTLEEFGSHGADGGEPDGEPDEGGDSGAGDDHAEDEASGVLLSSIAAVAWEGLLPLGLHDKAHQGHLLHEGQGGPGHTEEWVLLTDEGVHHSARGTGGRRPPRERMLLRS
jgi:hypothetical protein